MPSKLGSNTRGGKKDDPTFKSRTVYGPDYEYVEDDRYTGITVKPKKKYPVPVEDSPNSVYSVSERNHKIHGGDSLYTPKNKINRIQVTPGKWTTKNN